MSDDDEEEYSFPCAECQEAHFSLTYAQELRRMAREYKEMLKGNNDGK